MTTLGTGMIWTILMCRNSISKCRKSQSGRNAKDAGGALSSAQTTPSVTHALTNWRKAMTSEMENYEEICPECECGSGLVKEPEYDARGIFLTYACDKCRKQKLSKYRPDVLTDPNYWTDEPIDED